MIAFGGKDQEAQASKFKCTIGHCDKVLHLLATLLELDIII